MIKRLPSQQMDSCFRGNDNMPVHDKVPAIISPLRLCASALKTPSEVIHA